MDNRQSQSGLGDTMDQCAFDKLFTKSVPHILEEIFLSLNYNSFKTCLNVSRTWRKLLTSDSYQAKGKLVFHDDLLKDEEELLRYAWNGCNAGRVRELLSTGMLNIDCVWCKCSGTRTPLWGGCI